MKNSKSVSGTDMVFGIFFAILGFVALIISLMSLFPALRLMLHTTGVRYDYMVLSPCILLLALALTDNLKRGDKKSIG